jgi:hypothetical protein
MEPDTIERRWPALGDKVPFVDSGRARERARRASLREFWLRRSRDRAMRIPQSGCYRQGQGGQGHLERDFVSPPRRVVHPRSKTVKEKR